MSEESAAMLPTEGGEKEWFRKIPQHPVLLNKTSPQKKLVEQILICWGPNWAEEGKYPSAMHASHPDTPKGEEDTWETLVEFVV